MVTKTEKSLLVMIIAVIVIIGVNTAYDETLLKNNMLPYTRYDSINFTDAFYCTCTPNEN